MLSDFYAGKRVFLTGHTGFKGAWLSRMLSMLGAKVYGYSLTPPTEPSLYKLANIEDEVNSVIGDIRDFKRLKAAFDKAKPEIVFHLAAQPLVLDSYKNPLYTYEVNVMGTANLLECVRLSDSVKSVINVTTDKVYENKGWEWGYRENENLNGYDPYSNSKSCSELVTASYKNSFFNETGISVSTVRAGNVIGGGDFSPNRIIPDCVRAVQNGKALILRNPSSIRPYQHVLEPLSMYMEIARRQYEDRSLAGCYNVGPDAEGCITTEALVKLFAGHYSGFQYEINIDQNAPHEASFLKLDNAKVKAAFGYNPRLTISNAVLLTAKWSRVYINEENVHACLTGQIRRFLENE